MITDVRAIVDDLGESIIKTPVSWVEYKKALYEVDPILRNVRKVGQVHRIITRQCLRIIMQWRC